MKKFLTVEKLLDAKGRKEIEEKINTCSPRNGTLRRTLRCPREFAETGVYCTGDDCHKIRGSGKRPIAEVTPPRSIVEAVWTVPGFGWARLRRRARADSLRRYAACGDKTC